ncbi:MAG: hypothetical protein U0168_29725 [Nannocystaceae bacterium]
MSLRANIDHLAAAPGIVAVNVADPAGNQEFRGEESWSPILAAAMGLLKKTDESTIRLVIGQHTVVLQGEGEETVAVVLPTGHAIAKSLRRMIRRMSRKVRAPIVRPTLSPSVSDPTRQPSSWG